jgi:DNA-binding ferritin-like protein
MKVLLIHLRAMQLFTQHAHNLCGRVAFQQDHEFFGGVYEALDADYDSVVERIIGLGGEQDLELGSILLGVSAVLKGSPSIGVKENSVYYKHLLGM